MEISNAKPVSEQPLRNKNYLATKLERSAGEHKDAVAKWNRDHPGKPEGTSFYKTNWKSWSKQLYPSEQYRKGYDAIRWKD